MVPENSTLYDTDHHDLPDTETTEGEHAVALALGRAKFVPDEIHLRSPLSTRCPVPITLLPPLEAGANPFSPSLVPYYCFTLVRVSLIRVQPCPGFLRSTKRRSRTAPFLPAGAAGRAARSVVRLPPTPMSTQKSPTRSRADRRGRDRCHTRATSWAAGQRYLHVVVRDQQQPAAWPPTLPERLISGPSGSSSRTSSAARPPATAARRPA